jgi:hypothetical protein
MTADRFGHAHTATSQPAIAAFEAATYAVGAHRAIGDNLTRALELEPDLVSAWALRSVGNAMLARRETMAAAARDATEAAAALDRAGGGTQGERTLVEAARLTSAGRWNDAAMVLEWHLDDEPLDFLALKMAHGLRFMTGQRNAMLATTTRALRKWGDSVPGYGFVLGCHAFGLEEAGHYATAEAIGRRAVELEPSDAWGLHAVSHVMEMSGRTGEGIAWLGASRSIWPDCNNFRFHLGWHLALFHLELGNGPAVLDIYDREVMPAASDDFRDMANAVSLLWRLQQAGFDTGDRWAKLCVVANKRRADVTYVFASLHYLVALVANGEHAAAAELVGEMDALSNAGGGDQPAVARDIGIDLAKVILAGASQAGAVGVDLRQLASMLPSIGGSNAQRDLFMQILLMFAHDPATLSAVGRMRKLLRRDDAFTKRLAAARSLDAFAKSELDSRKRA